MAHANEDSMPVPERFDGALRCRLCPDLSPAEDNDWCPLAAGVVCDDCCRALMMGDERLLDAVSRRRGHEIGMEQVVESCMQCERLVRLVTETTGDGDGVRLRPN